MRVDWDAHDREETGTSSETGNPQARVHPCTLAADLDVRVEYADGLRRDTWTPGHLLRDGRLDEGERERFVVGDPVVAFALGFAVARATPWLARSWWARRRATSCASKSLMSV